MKAKEKLAYQLAKVSHRGQKDDCGFDYFRVHILQVVKLIKQVTTDMELIQAAYLHDVIEDTNYTYEDIKHAFGKRVADLVNEVTHEGNKDEKGHYFPRLCSRDAIILKFADRLSNLSRMEAWDKKRKQHYLKKSKFWREA